LTNELSGDELIAEREYEFIIKHGISSRDGYIPVSFDEIGDAELREWCECELMQQLRNERADFFRRNIA
jgi:hypothetical protein